MPAIVTKIFLGFPRSLHTNAVQEVALNEEGDVYNNIYHVKAVVPEMFPGFISISVRLT
jgi:hypothetical protein